MDKLMSLVYFLVLLSFGAILLLAAIAYLNIPFFNLENNVLLLSELGLLLLVLLFSFSKRD